MLLRARRLLLGVWIATGLGFPATAQQSPLLKTLPVEDFPVRLSREPLRGNGSRRET